MTEKPEGAGFQNYHVPLEHVRQPLRPRQILPDADLEETYVVLEQMITDEQILTATTADVLAGTQLDQPGVPGVFTVWAASDQVDTTITINLGGRIIVNGAVVTQRAVSIILESDDPFYQMLSRGAGRPVISITEVTAAVIRVRTRFIPAIRT